MVCVSSKIFLTTSQQPRHVLRKVQSIPSRYSPARLAKVLILRLPSVRETLCTTELLGRTAPQGTKPYMDGNTKKQKQTYQRSSDPTAIEVLQIKPRRNEKIRLSDGASSAKHVFEVR